MSRLRPTDRPFRRRPDAGRRSPSQNTSQCFDRCGSQQPRNPGNGCVTHIPPSRKPCDYLGRSPPVFLDLSKSHRHRCAQRTPAKPRFAPVAVRTDFIQFADAKRQWRYGRQAVETAGPGVGQRSNGLEPVYIRDMKRNIRNILAIVGQNTMVLTNGAFVWVRPHADVETFNKDNVIVQRIKRVIVFLSGDDQKDPDS